MHKHGQPETDSQPPAVTMGFVLMNASEDSALTGDVRVRLDRIWADRTAQDIANLGTAGFVAELITILPDADGYSNALRLKVAKDVVALLRDFDFVNQASVVQQATSRVYRVERNFNEMSLKQLLEHIIAHPEDYNDAKRYIISQETVVAAQRRTIEWVVPLNEPDDNAPNIDVEATISYAACLTDRLYQVQTVLRDGRRPMSLDRAMDVDNRPLVHPLLGVLLRGPMDGFEFDELLQRDPDRYDSAIWARKTSHRLLPDITDIFAACEELFREPISPRWQRIKADYLTAKERQHSDALSIVHFWPEDLPTDANVFVIVTTQVIDYKALVRANVLSSLSKTGSNLDIRRGPYTTIAVSGSNLDFHGTIVIEGGYARGSNADGKIYVPPGVHVTVTGSNNDAEVITVTWEWIARKLGLV